ncbi:IS66 Orf2 like protein [uncultured Clostridium sp.]|nr:IS66 Orf2 like protein [uncultured Clostridium sp.]SCJ09421.1 IS66 Orf2 like protein [uncultured Clostridium sp.]
MSNLEDVDRVYMACGFTDLRKSIDGPVLVVQNDLNLETFEKVLFVVCNRKQNRLKNLHFDENF